MISDQTRDMTKGRVSCGELLDVSRLHATSVGDTASARLFFGLTMVLYGSMILFTRPLSFGDSIYYAQTILGFRRHPDARTLRFLLDFGHLLWRPLGLVLYDMVRAVLPVTAPGEDRLLILKILICVSMLSGAIATGMLYMIVRGLGFRPVVCFLVCATFIFSNACIYAAQTGLSYMLGLACVTTALWMAMQRVSANYKAMYPHLWCTGMLLAFAAAAWFPFVLVAPTVAVAAAVPWNESEFTSIRSLSFARAVHVMGANIIWILTIFGIAAWILRINTIAGIRTWMSGSAHGWRQTSSLLRLGMGLPRCCVALKDNAGVIWKRYVFHDPYASVKPQDLLQSSLVLMAAFYFGLILLLYTLARDKRGRMFAGLLTIAALPVLYFGVFLFEPSSIERFIPVFPFYFVALGYHFQCGSLNLKQQCLALIYPLVLIASTLATYNNRSVERYWEPTQARLEAITQQVPLGSAVTLLGNWDEIFLFSKDNPLHDTVSGSVDLWVLLQPAHERIFCWRQLFASRVAEAWTGKKEMWLSQRLLAPVPRPEWEWVEGDDQAIHWSQLPEFFCQFQFDQRIDDSDGFVRLASTETNRELLSHVATQGCKPSVKVR